MQTAKQHEAHTLSLLQTVPGIGTILSLVLLYAIHDMDRFPRVQDFASYGRLGTCAKESGGTRLGTSGKNLGHAPLTWAFSEAAGLFLRNNEPGQDPGPLGEKARPGESPEHPGAYTGPGGL